MCGIIGYVGERQATPILLDGLKRLEYRGYDSSGICVIVPTSRQKHRESVPTSQKSRNPDQGVGRLRPSTFSRSVGASDDHKVVLRKIHGKIQNLQNLLQSHPFPDSSIGISHTRWATHGAPNRLNAHPHTDCTGKIFLVHNGIIENYEELKKNLQKQGHRIVSDTDTEVIVHLIEENYKGDLLTAVQKAIRKLRGAFAIAVIAADEPNTLVAARIGSPLIIGLGRHENFIASDVPAILEHTKRIIYLKDGQLASVKKDQVQIFSFAGKMVKPKIDKVTFKVDAVQKQGYAHFMLKEIHEQPDVLRQMLRTRLHGKTVYLEGLGLTDQQLKEIRHVMIVACGTAYHAGMVGKYVIESLSSVPVTIDVSSEFRYRNPIIGKKTLVLAISQSGETADTLAAVREAKAKGAKIISICNVLGSSLARESDGVLYTHAGPEIGVASTKAYTAQLCMLYLIAIKLGIIHGVLSGKDRHTLVEDLKHLPVLYEKILENKNIIAQVGRANSHFGCFLFLGRNINYPSALEGALKLKEISYIPAEGYAAGEMKHGPIALIDEYRAVVCVAPESPTYEKMISNMQEIRARKGKIIAIATEGDKAIGRHANHVIYVPKTNVLLTPLLVALPLQLIAYYISVKRGCDVDQPRNLAKSVTVE